MVIIFCIVACILVLIIFFGYRHYKSRHTKMAEEMARQNELLQETANELVKAKEQAEQSSRSKNIFLSQMSHEVRTPMNAILGIAEIQLRDETLRQSTQEAFGLIYESGDLLLNIINNVLDLSKIESGKLELVPVIYNIPSLINDTAQLNQMHYDSKPIDFSIHVDGNTPYELNGDELRIKQVLNNILSNAFKYTDEGKIEFAVSAESVQDDTAMIVFRISDTGQGMTNNQLGRLFDDYSRFNLYTNRSVVGVGLGMSITKRLVDLMNGSIIVQSDPGKGSVFTVRIPQKRIGTAVCGTQPAEKLQYFRFQSTAITKKVQFIREYMPYGSVLVVDDVESNIYVIKGMLLPYGLQIDTAASGFEAIKKIKDGNVYDIVFMDHMMPKMDGIETTKNLRAMGFTRSIVALTALAGRAEMFLENGFDRFIAKPIDSRELNSILNELIRNKQPAKVIEAARREIENSRPAPDVPLTAVRKAAVSDELSGAVIRDIESAIAVLEALLPGANAAGGAFRSEADLSLFSTTVHGIKSAFANIGETQLSNAALKLEEAALQTAALPVAALQVAASNGETSTLSMEIPVFMDSLRSFMEKMKRPEADNNAELSPGDAVFLRNKLEEIKSACEKLFLKDAKAAIAELKQKELPQDINIIISEISLHLVRGEYAQVVSAADKALDRVNV